MNRTVNSALLVVTVIVGISTMIPGEAYGQFLRGRHGGHGHQGARHGAGHCCQPAPVCCPPVATPVCCTPMYGQGTGLAASSYFPGYHMASQPTFCCTSIGISDSDNQGIYRSGMQNLQDNYDAQGNRIDAQGNRFDDGTQYNQERFDAQGNRIAPGSQYSGDTYDSQGNRIAAGSQYNQNRFNSQGNRSDLQNQFNQDGTRVDSNLNRQQNGLDSQGNRTDALNQGNQGDTRLDSNLDVQQQNRVDSQGDRTDALNQGDQGGTQPDSDRSQLGVQGSADAGASTTPNLPGQSDR